MRLVLIRHGIAEDRAKFAATGQADGLRPLTTEGRRKMAHNVRGLRHAVKTFDILAASPLTRAQQTAEIVAGAYRGVEITTVSVLDPAAARKEVVAWLRRQRATATVAAVGHEPQLGQLATWLLSRRSECHVVFRKGGACRIDFSGRPAAGMGQLVWALTPELLRRLAR